MLDVNYIGVFLTLRCNLGCEYCLNRQGDFVNRKEISADKWWDILKNLETREDLPISLQGGEPTMYKDFYPLVHILHLEKKKIDVLTNGEFDVEEFIEKTEPKMFIRKAPYASIRFSFHANTNGPLLVRKMNRLQRRGYPIGVWGLNHPAMKLRNRMMAEMCREVGIDYREKEYLDAEHGTYKYPDAIKGHQGRMVRCTPSEMLFAPDGQFFPCHHFLYSGVHPNIQEGVTQCADYGLCNPCDVKLKTNRLQEGGHCSVRIEELENG